MASTDETDAIDWNNDTVLKFLNFYMKEECIWNPSHKLHKNRNEVFDAWKRIQAEFSEHISIADLKRKKDSLMATFRNCVQKVKKSEHCGVGTDKIYKPNWFAYTTMSKFLLHHDTPRNTINSEVSDIFNTDNVTYLIYITVYR